MYTLFLQVELRPRASLPASSNQLQHRTKQQQLQQPSVVAETHNYSNNFNSRNQPPRLFTPTKLYTSLDVAKEEAAAYVLAMVTGDSRDRKGGNHGNKAMRPEASGFQPHVMKQDEVAYPVYASPVLMNNY